MLGPVDESIRIFRKDSKCLPLDTAKRTARRLETSALALPS